HLRDTPRSGLRDLDAEIEQELQEAMAGMSEEEMFADPAPQRRRTPGTPAEPGKLKGKVLRIHGKDIFVDVPGCRRQGVITAMQFHEGLPKIGDEIEIHIEGAEDGMLLLSRKGAAVEADWSTVAPGMIVEARITATNKGGLSVEINGIRGFMPSSQIDVFRVTNAE